MRTLLLVSILAGCTVDTQLVIDPTDGPPLGVGLVQDYSVMKEVCSDPDSDCNVTATMSPLHVTISKGSVVDLLAVDLGQFRLLGSAEGATNLTLSADDMSLSVHVDVASVSATTLSAPRAHGFRALTSPIDAFVGSVIEIDQQNLGPRVEARAGRAAYNLVRGATQLQCFESTCRFFATGMLPGAAQITTPLAALALNVDDASALADFTIGDGSATEQTLHLTSDPTDLWLLATTAAGHPILGLGGPKPVAVIADPSVISVAGSGTEGVVPSLRVATKQVGTTTMQITWGSVIKTFTIDVTR